MANYGVAYKYKNGQIPVFIKRFSKLKIEP